MSEVYKVFRSGISWWLFGPILVLFGFLTIKLFIEDQEIMGGIFSFLFFLTIHLLFNTYYILSREKFLVIKAGFFFAKKILVDDISKIEKTNIAISSPAASFKRIEIFYGKFGSVVISPKNQQGFLEEVKKLNPKIELKGF